ncbi:unnamed protein product [Amoebophrya sp. A120]|nr:unnamed protein product [Amoebophrya sp. A120]|eukprot:GSA120T00014645001.1
MSLSSFVPFQARPLRRQYNALPSSSAFHNTTAHTKGLTYSSALRASQQDQPSTRARCRYSDSVPNSKTFTFLVFRGVIGASPQKAPSFLYLVAFIDIYFYRTSITKPRSSLRLQ